MSKLLKNIGLAFLVVCSVQVATFAQKKKNTTKPKVTVQKPAESEEEAKKAETAAKPNAKPQSVPLAEREVIEVTPAPKPAPVASTTKVVSAPKKVDVTPVSIHSRLYEDSLSVHPIDPSNVLYRITNWRRMDLKEKVNQPFFSKNAEITKFLIDAVKTGKLKAYTNDSVTTELSMEAFAKNMIMENTGGDGLSEEEKKAGFGNETNKGGAVDDGWGGTSTKPSSTTPKKNTKNNAAVVDDGWGGTTSAPATNTKPATGGDSWANNGSSAGSGEAEYFARDLTILEIKEDFIFDKQRSRAYNSIQTLSIIIPAEKTVRGFDVPVATFKYKDLDKFFRSNPKCIWYNFKNTAQHKNMADAFDLRLFQARIIKQSNPGDAFLVDIYKGDKAGLRASELLENQLMEYEHNLWEY